MRKIVSLIMITGLLVVLIMGCASVPNNENQEMPAVTIVTIENINSMSLAGIWLFEELPVGSTNTALSGGVFVNKKSLSVYLTFPDETKGNTWNSNEYWQGEGDFFIVIVPIVNFKYQIKNAMIYVGNKNEPIKYSFKNDDLVTFSFSEFKKWGQFIKQ